MKLFESFLISRIRAHFRGRLYYRVFSCLIFSVPFCASVIFIISILSIKGYGVSFSALTGGHAYNVSNPITIVSFSATFVTISLTLLGFALNNFSKRGYKTKKENEEQNNLNYEVNASVFEECANILLVRYRGVKKSLLCFNVASFPLLSKAFTLIIILLSMIAQCFFGSYRIFYLIVYAGIMGFVILLVLIDVFRIYADVNFTLYQACSIIASKFYNKLSFLYSTRKFDSGYIGTVKNYVRTDIYRGILFLHESYGTILYLPYKFEKKLKLMLDNNKHMLSELAMCSSLSTSVMFEKYYAKQRSSANFDAKEIFSVFISTSINSCKGLVEDLNYEINFVRNTEEIAYYNAREDILKLLEPIYYDKIKKENELYGQKEN